ncbi:MULTISPECIES: conjugal transfer protein TraN [Sphingobium]|uniref:Conjugal transfer protein TraN n=2 Tax=Sphingobium TaxID=165695 RepID=A0A0M3AH37_9SPHN|nr:MULTISPECIES: conjugal transfer protein TraN [Sphingobium]NML91578.1 conjugal transfer protein TraN [Sphingobium sp. TB-6]OAP30374.1 conjugal transfer protein TraN [Sphingobium sp. 20006FA]KKW89343.1 conjugal transfer protein TraN [Sphingobium chungbukense]KXU30826.1 conjugal transfer protein TraN [Sphingobium sp. AM]KYC30653.1 conjugal transfer protein TraN [Sphingobium sp. 22B]
MRYRAALLLLISAAAAAAPLYAQMTQEQAREEGKGLGNAMRSNGALVPSEQSQAEAVPGYAGSSLQQGDYFDDPEKLENDSAALKSTSESYRITTDADRTRATFDNDEIKSTASRATTIENDPGSYLQGQEIGGTSGSCTALPPGDGQSSSYEATCNAGASVDQSQPSCTVPQVPQFEEKTAYRYSCGYWYNEVWHKQIRWDPNTSSSSCTGFETAPTCSLESTSFTVERRYVGRLNKDRSLYQSNTVRTYSCTAPAASTNGKKYCDAFGCFTPAPVVDLGSGTTKVHVGTADDLASCVAPVRNGQCTLTSSVCTDSEPRTRMVDGVSVTQDCWAKANSYQCTIIGEGNDCADLEANAQCSFLRKECIDDEEDPAYDPGACKVFENVYRCPVPQSERGAEKQYICGGDVYCINGDCEPIVREASTEFKDALVALHSIDQAGKEFDENNFTVFSGERDSCHKPVFGLINCCAGKTSGLLTIGAGAAALAGGPAAIAALATPFLTLFACSQGEMKLDIKDRMGFCHKVGTYCSSSILGICKTKRTAYCCFESKLSRILQEQGRIQLNKPWDKPKKEQCKGFTIEEFASLDLSVMDFTEVYSEFMDAAKLPDEVQTMTDIQAKIQGYYDLHGQ